MSKKLFTILTVVGLLAMLASCARQPLSYNESATEYLAGSVSKSVPKNVYIDTSETEYRVVNVLDYGAVGDGIADDTDAILSAMQDLSDHAALYFPAGKYKFLTDEVVKLTASNILIYGRGATIICTTFFEANCSNVTVRDLNFINYKYSKSWEANSCIAIRSDSEEVYKRLTVDTCTFEGFFYAVDARTLSGDIPAVEEINIIKCKSTAPKNKAAGHFQTVCVKNVTMTENMTFGGMNSASYHCSNTTGFIRVANNFDNGNAYASCVIEDSSSECAIRGNTFRSKVWVDDSQNIAIDSNVVDTEILVTTQSSEPKCININSNVAGQVKVSGFGGQRNYLATNINISDNILTYNDAAKYICGIYLADASLSDGSSTGAFAKVKINDNLIVGNYTKGSIYIIRRQETGPVYLQDNICESYIWMTSTGSKIYAKGNFSKGFLGGQPTVIA